MRQSITTKYLGPSNVRGSRIKAIARKRNTNNGWAEQSHTEPYRYEGTEQEHCRAAKILAAKLQWSGLWVGGGNVDENGYVFVNVCDHYKGAPTESIGMKNRDWFFIQRQPEKFGTDPETGQPTIILGDEFADA